MGVQEWLLPGVEMSSECVCSWHIGYPNYYARLEQLFTRTAEGDEIFIVGWSLDHNTKLSKRSVLDLLTAALGRGAHVRVLLSSVSDSPAENSAAVTTIGALKGNVQAVLDSQVLAHGSHHQKAIYVQTGKSRTLLLGGMDIVAAQRRNANGTNAWFDAQAEVQGRAADLGKRTLEERWSSVTGGSSPPPFVPQKGQGITFVQFVRTFGKPDSPASRARTYAPSGAFTTHDLILRGCERAHKFIYIEDQFYVGERVNGANPAGFSKSIDEALRDAAARGVKIVAVTTHATQAFWFMPKLRRRQLKDLVTSGLPDLTRYKVFRLKGAFARPRTSADSRTLNFVHTKVWIFDDQLALVGSANFSRSSMTYESELGAAVVSNKDSLVPDLRARLWLALLNAPGAPGGFKDGDVRDFATGVAAFESSGSSLEPYAPDSGVDEDPGPPPHPISVPAEFDGSGP